jgi:non-homologous end joining protein Ku
MEKDLDRTNVATTSPADEIEFKTTHRHRLLGAKRRSRLPLPIDLMAALKRSLAQETGQPSAKPRRKAARDRR